MAMAVSIRHLQSPFWSRNLSKHMRSQMWRRLIISHWMSTICSLRGLKLEVMKENFSSKRNTEQACITTTVKIKHHTWRIQVPYSPTKTLYCSWPTKASSPCSICGSSRRSRQTSRISQSRCVRYQEIQLDIRVMKTLTMIIWSWRHRSAWASSVSTQRLWMRRLSATLSISW